MRWKNTPDSLQDPDYHYLMGGEHETEQIGFVCLDGNGRYVVKRHIRNSRSLAVVGNESVLEEAKRLLELSAPV